MANRLLQDPFSVLKEYPEKLTDNFKIPFQGECLRFSHGGDYLAVGCSNGSVVIYDMDTKKPISMLGNRGGPHVRSVQSISWSQCGRFIWTCSSDWSVKMWDLQTPGVCYKEYRFDGPVWMCKALRARSRSCLAMAYEHKNAFLLDFSGEEVIKLEIKDAFSGEVEDSDVDYGYTLVTCVHSTLNDIILTGTSKGWLIVYRILRGDEGFKCIKRTRIGHTNIKHIEVVPYGDRMAINCSDRTIRQYSLHIDEGSSEVVLELEHKYQDVINKLQWNSIAFSNHSGEYLVASAHGSSAHDLYLWETASGTLVRVLEGPDEELLAIDWNFYNMCIASNGLESGNVYIWSIVIPPKWSALAPDFEEIDENVEYQEKENEFDQLDEFGYQQVQEEAEEVHIDLKSKEKYDVRGNDLSLDKFIIPTDYEGILMMKKLQSIG
ncbi:HFL010Wp [Eremothecium sinecaudum]|uniref:HFL010Wp n=1 Tax=Eremothecium sinecaudum TaxID=45286 RepID=A0A0X8HUP0_9SACH|nr:HFL010Wp [Eremothecium sinecaudum]AMD21846.1 HFL010Wp [Eremothecium sinecaudum]